jgi:hypothetical protein
MACSSIKHYTVELYLSGLIGMVCCPDMKKIQIIGFFLKMGYIGSLKFGGYYLQYVPASKLLTCLI